ncbi:MAG: ATP-binding cassette domain-containing protein, partial [Planctomycetaceae bacterium]|nr:ATP-binding cassette domain-containing protein [Planctomycetaceae bacterium]
MVCRTLMLEVDIVKRFRDFTLSVHFSAEDERLGILGASGCGKSMTLRCIAGITKPDEGFIRINDRVVFDSKRRINLPPQERRTGYLFQHYALFPTMTLRQNWEIVLRHLSNEKRKHLVEEMLEKLHLQGLEDSPPAKLSGGQKQRAAMGRMLLSAP